MNNAIKVAEYIFESSWEVCNKVGGIYTVLSTKARSLEHIYPGRTVFIGPDLWKKETPADFICDETLFAPFKEHASACGELKIRVGRWDVPGRPPVILVDPSPFAARRDKFFYEVWESFGVDSLRAYGDYDEACIFAYAAARVIEGFYNFYKLEGKGVVALFNEWMLGMGALYLQKHLPAVATIFTTHATSVGRSIAGNNKPLYSALESYDGDLVARELNIEAKHSLEKQAAFFADCFTTVSDITARECKELLGKAPDIVTPNGFEPDYVPVGADYDVKRGNARALLMRVAGKLTGCSIDPNAILLSTSGRYEYHNKGIDVFIEAINSLRLSGDLGREVVAFIMVPAWTSAARGDLRYAVKNDYPVSAPLQAPFCTHWLNLMESDRILGFIARKGFTNGAGEKVKIIFAPCYLTGGDGIFDTSYYDLLPGMDATIYPSYYEPWGYTPHESIAFGVPTVTTDLAGFGLWAGKEGAGQSILQGVRVIHRDDNNYFEVAAQIAQTILTLSQESPATIAAIRDNCRRLASKAQWSHFIAHYQAAFSLALQKAASRGAGHI
jgi:glycosyltransferase involved in cell wall biosynthesis